MKQKKQNQKKIEKPHFNDLLLPIIFVLCVLPFSVYLAEYDYGYSEYAWHSDYSVLLDFYTYYRHIFFLVAVAFIVVILLFRMNLYKEYTKDFKIFYPLAGYSVFVLVSSIFSVNARASWVGNGVSIETVWALIGYGLVAFYTYQIMEEKDYSSILRGIYVMFVPMSIVGWFQIFKCDLLHFEWMQRLTMSDALFMEYGGEVEDLFTGNNVFLTLYNPNFAAVFLVMFICVFFVLAIYADDLKTRMLNVVFLLDALVLCWFTYTRAALVALAVSFVAFVFLIVKNRKMRVLKIIIPSMVVLAAVLLLYDVSTGGKYINRLVEEQKITRLDSMLTTERGVEITYDDKLYVLSLSEEDGTITVVDEIGNVLENSYTKDNEIELPFAEDALAFSMNWEGFPSIVMFVEDTTFQFIVEDGEYYYYTDWGKMDSMTSIAHVDFNGLESLGSGRVYIWSRILPILKNYIFIGSGPDTFAEVFPQNDYIGKMYYANNMARVIERAHNDYLMRWVQTGLCSLICLCVFYGAFLKNGFLFYQQDAMNTLSSKIGFGCFLGCIGYLVCSFFSDSTLYSTPTFYVFIGLALAATKCTRK